MAYIQRNYLDFDLLLLPVEGGFQARVLNSPVGQAVGVFGSPFEAEELQEMFARMGRSHRGPAASVGDEQQAVEAFGARLFDAVFTGRVRSCLQRSLDEATRRAAGLRIRLRLNEVPDLADLPWEFLFDTGRGMFFSHTHTTPIVRFLEMEDRPRPLEMQLPLRVLVVISSPRDHPPLNLQNEWDRLESSLSSLTSGGAVVLEKLEEATLPVLQNKLRLKEYHVLHFIGHGGFDEARQEGTLVFEDENEDGVLVGSQLLGTLLHDAQSLRLVVLNACEGGRVSRLGPFAGVAQSLVKQSIPAVIAMQFPVSDQAAIAFAREFYTALGENAPVDLALAEARKAMLALGGSIEWGTPVLYLRAPDGQLFDLAGGRHGAAPGTDQSFTQTAKTGLNALARLMKTPAVRAAVVAFRTDFQAASEQITILGYYKLLHELFQELEDRFYLIDHDRKRLPADDLAWEGLEINEPEVRTKIDDLLQAAAQAKIPGDDIWWVDQLTLVKVDLRASIEDFDERKLALAAHRLRRVLDRQVSRVNTSLVAAAGALRLSALVVTLQSIQARIATPDMPQEARDEFDGGMLALLRLDKRLAALVAEHNDWQVIDDQLRRVEANLEQDLTELELAWPDVKAKATMMYSSSTSLYGGERQEWAVALATDGQALEQSLASAALPQTRRFFRRYRSQAARRFRQVNGDLLKLSQDLQRVGDSLDTLLRTIG